MRCVERMKTMSSQFLRFFKIQRFLCGVLVSSDGWIITNAHVVSEMKDITVVTSDGKQFIGEKKYVDEESDLALIRIGAVGLPAASFASKDVRVGETVIAIGTPISFALRN